MKHTQLDNLPEQSVSHNPEIKKRVMLALGDLPHLTNFSQAHFAPGQVSPGHAHADLAEVFFVETGAGEIEVDGQTLPLRPGTCVAVSPHEWHELRAAPDSELVITYFGLKA